MMGMTLMVTLQMITVVEITPLPEIEVTKTATVTDNNNNGLVDLADTAVYTITVENKGNAVVSGVFSIH